MRERLADLLCPGRLRVHAFVHRLETWRERLHLMNDLREVRADLADFVHSAPHFFGELVHAHHSRRYRRLHLLHHFLDVVSRDCRLVGQAPDFHGHNGEAQPVLARLLGFNRRVEGEQIGLVGHFCDRGHHRVDVGGLFAQHSQFGADRAGSVHDLSHCAFHSAN